MFNFGLIQNLSRLFFLSIGVSLLAHLKRKCKARRETEFFLQNSVSVAPFLNMSQSFIDTQRSYSGGGKLSHADCAGHGRDVSNCRGNLLLRD